MKVTKAMFQRSGGCPKALSGNGDPGVDWRVTSSRAATVYDVEGCGRVLLDAQCGKGAVVWGPLAQRCGHVGGRAPSCHVGDRTCPCRGKFARLERKTECMPCNVAIGLVVGVRGLPSM